MSSLLLRSLVLPALALSAAVLPAQTYIGGPAALAEPAVTGSSLRARNLANANPGGNNPVFIANSASALGTTDRDSYTGRWSTSAAQYTFSVVFNKAASTLTVSLPQLIGLGTPPVIGGGNNSANVTSSNVGNVFTISNVGSFNAFRLFSNLAGEIDGLTYNGTQFGGLAPDFALAAGSTHFFRVNGNANFTIDGRLTLPTNGTSVEVNRFEVGVATANSVVPEPSTYALMGAGLVGLAGVARRRRVTA